MAQTSSTALVEGFTRLSGPGSPMTRTRPTGVVIQDSGGYDYYLWVDTSGRLRITDAATAEAAGFNWNSGGTIVGTQS